MSKGFPLSWDTWVGGVQAAYAIKAELDKRVAACDLLFKDERQTHKRVTDIVERYYPSGRKRPGAKRRKERIDSVGATVVSLALNPGGKEVVWQPDIEGARAEINRADWRSETGI